MYRSFKVSVRVYVEDRYQRSEIVIVIDIIVRQPFVRVIYSDEGLTLETSVSESFTVANLPYRPCG